MTTNSTKCVASWMRFLPARNHFTLKLHGRRNMRRQMTHLDSRQCLTTFWFIVRAKISHAIYWNELKATTPTIVTKIQRESFVSVTTPATRQQKNAQTFI